MLAQLATRMSVLAGWLVDRANNVAVSMVKHARLARFTEISGCKWSTASTQNFLQLDCQSLCMSPLHTQGQTWKWQEEKVDRANSASKSSLLQYPTTNFSHPPIIKHPPSRIDSSNRK